MIDDKEHDMKEHNMYDKQESTQFAAAVLEDAKELCVNAGRDWYDMPDIERHEYIRMAQEALGEDE